MTLLFLVLYTWGMQDCCRDTCQALDMNYYYHYADVHGDYCVCFDGTEKIAVEVMCE